MGEGACELRIGVAGLGRAFTVMLPTFTSDPRVRLVAAADPRPEARARFAVEFSGNSYEAVEELCADPAVDVVYVATPHQLHAQHAIVAAHDLPHRGVALDAAQQIVFLRSHRVSSSSHALFFVSRGILDI